MFGSLYESRFILEHLLWLDGPSENLTKAEIREMTDSKQETRQIMHAAVNKSNSVELANVDVLVVGGGPAGFAAAISAARQGADTLLVEATGCLGGQGTSGLVGPFMPTPYDGIHNELREKLQNMHGLHDMSFDVEILKYTMQLMVEEAGAKQLLFAMAESALMQDRTVTGITLAAKGGSRCIKAKVVVDCTGDGDIAASAGALYEKGNDVGRMQGTTLFFHIGGVNDAEFIAGQEQYLENMDYYLKTAREHGVLNLPPYARIRKVNVRKGSILHDGMYSVNVDTAAGIDGTDPWSLTAGMNDSRKRVFEIIEYFRQYLPGAKNCFLLRTGSIFGIRETRRFNGVEYLTGRDAIEGRKRKDGICRASYMLDLHDGDFRNGNFHANLREKYGRTHLHPGDWYEIPLGCLIPASVDGLLLAGRHISSDRDSNGSLRCMPTCMATGQAAGIAAAICSQEGIVPRNLPYQRVQEILREKYGVMMAHDMNLSPEK